jgi:hypothetical protein
VLLVLAWELLRLYLRYTAIASLSKYLDSSTPKNDYSSLAAAIPAASSHSLRDPQEVPPHDPPLPVSSVSFYELTFGTVAGICAGIFIKKGAKAIAWFLGGIFVLLQVCITCYCVVRASAHGNDALSILVQLPSFG